MSTLKHLRNQVKCIKSTQKITKAMQMVSAAKFKKIKTRLQDSNYYIDALSNIIAEVSSSTNLGDFSPQELLFFSRHNLEKPELLIVITSERGLCGSFNSSLIKKVKTDIENLEQSGKEFKLIIVGKKGYEVLKNKYLNFIDGYFNIGDSNNKNAIIATIKEKIMHLIEIGSIGSCSIYFNKFKNAITHIPTGQSILPIQQKNSNTLPSGSNYEEEGSNLLLDIINLYIIGQLNFALLQSAASEEGARMTAMDNATKNANEIINTLTLKLNRSRQAIITKQLIEVISGVEAL